jgi:hypothetical protein
VPVDKTSHRCCSCKYAEVVSRYRGKFVECRRYAPRWGRIGTMNQVGLLSAPLPLEYWCGEFEARDDR